MNLPFIKSDRPSVSELRVEDRTHLFLAAVLSAGTTQTPVHIRNLSASGALIEGLVLPVVDSVVSIRRGGLCVGGVVAWRSQNQAGIAFKSHIVVSTWLPKNSRSRQCAIDQIVFASRNASDVLADPRNPDCALTEFNSALAELAALRSDLVTLGDLLVRDTILVGTHPEIQLLDVAIQRLDRIVSRMTEAGKGQTLRKTNPKLKSGDRSIRT